MLGQLYQPKGLALETAQAVLEVENPHACNVATSSKKGISRFNHVRHGMTVVSVDSKFWQKWEPNTLPLMERIKLLENEAEYSWGSMEPYPVSAIWKQDVNKLLEEIKFLDLLIFGKWNYDKRANTETARRIRGTCPGRERLLQKLCYKAHVKSDTLEFIGENETVG